LHTAFGARLIRGFGGQRQRRATEFFWVTGGAVDSGAFRNRGDLRNRGALHNGNRGALRNCGAVRNRGDLHFLFFSKHLIDQNNKASSKLLLELWPIQKLVAEWIAQVQFLHKFHGWAMASFRHHVFQAIQNIRAINAILPP
jgi:hypothetical protein